MDEQSQKKHWTKPMATTRNASNPQNEQHADEQWQEYH
jgi:hypothetical protein